MVFLTLWFTLRFPCYRIDVNREASELNVLVIKSSLSSLFLSTSGAGTSYPFRTSEYIAVYSWDSCWSV